MYFSFSAVLLRSDIESIDGFPEDHHHTHSQKFLSQSETSASFIGMASTDAQTENSWLDDVRNTDGGIESSCDVEQEHNLVSESRSQPHHILKRAPLGSYITVTSSEGDRVYLRLKSNGTESNQSGFLHTHSGLQLLKVPFSELKESVEEEVI